eukprot:GHVP01060118.1.p1 GENE.GHVP01060118.1~~GHVP01060118.1.p1  ORF type:complete len:167 (+),score=34.95 GHVP01060118.1:669-1169(+)
MPSTDSPKLKHRKTRQERIKKSTTTINNSQANNKSALGPKLFTTRATIGQPVKSITTDEPLGDEDDSLFSDPAGPLRRHRRRFATLTRDSIIARPPVIQNNINNLDASTESEMRWCSDNEECIEPLLPSSLEFRRLEQKDDEEDFGNFLKSYEKEVKERTDNIPKF